MIITCLQCGKEFKSYNYGRPVKYCSRECFALARTKLKTVTLQCDFCGKEFNRKVDKQFLSHKHHFCSNFCANEYQKLGKIKFTCRTCGKEFYRSPSWTSQKKGYFCSISCRNANDDWISSAIFNANAAQSNKLKLNRLEQQGNLILDSLNLNYCNQYLINNVARVDVFIPQYNLIIQWDGDYWHGKGLSLDEMDYRQRKRVLLDKSQDAYFKHCGFNELRFWESDVNGDREFVCNTILDTIGRIDREYAEGNPIMLDVKDKYNSEQPRNALFDL